MNRLREAIFDQIHAERERQDLKFGEQNHIPIEWCAILGEEVGEVNKEALEHHFNFFKIERDETKLSEAMVRYREELIQVASVAVAMIECLDRKEHHNVKNK